MASLREQVRASLAQSLGTRIRHAKRREAMVNDTLLLLCGMRCAVLWDHCTVLGLGAAQAADEVVGGGVHLEQLERFLKRLP